MKRWKPPQSSVINMLPHAIAEFGHMSADSTVYVGRSLLVKIEQTGVEMFTQRELPTKCKRRFKKVADMNASLSVLVQHGGMRPQPSGVEVGTGRPASTMFEVKPLSLAQKPHIPQKYLLVGSSLDQMTAMSIRSLHELIEDGSFLVHPPRHTFATYVRRYKRATR